MNKPLAGVGVIFDLDGTLIDTAHDLAASMNVVLAFEGFDPLDVERVRHLVGFGAKAMIREGFSVSGVSEIDDAVMERHVERFLSHYLNHIADLSRPFPHALWALEALIGDGAKLAICTNKREQPARKLIETLGLAHFFETIVGMDTTINAKPDPAPVQLCVETLNAQAAVLVGDSDTDMRAAANADLPCFVHENGYGPMDLLSSAAASFDDYRRLPILVKREIGQ